MSERSLRSKEIIPYINLALFINLEAGSKLPGFVTLDQLIYWSRSRDGQAFSNPPKYWIHMMEKLNTKERLYLSANMGMTNRCLSRVHKIINPAIFHVRSTSVLDMSQWTVNLGVVTVFGKARASFMHTAFGKMKE